MNEAGYVVCATCGDYAVDFNAVMLDCSTCENSYHHTCVGMGLGELGRRTAATNAMRKSKSKKGGADGDVTGTLYDWICPDCHQQQQPRQPEPDKNKEEVLVIEDTDEDEDDGERTTYIDLSYNVDIHRVAPSQRALLPTTTTARRPAVHMQNVAGLLNRTNVGASTSASRASNPTVGASTSKPVPASTSASTSPESHTATTSATTTRNVQTPLSPPPSRSPSRTGPIAPVPFVDFTAMATSSKKRRRSSEAEDERAKKKSRLAGPARPALLRTPVEPIDLTLSDDEVLATPAVPSTSSRHAGTSVSSAGSRSRHGPGSVSSGTTDIATEDEPVPTRNLMRASLAGRTPRVPLPLASSALGARGTEASSSATRPAASNSTMRPAASGSTTRTAASPTASSRSRSTVPSKRRLSASPSNAQIAPVKRPVVQKQPEREGPEQEDEDDEEHAFFRSRRPSGVGGGGGLTRTRSDAAVLPASTSSAALRSTAPTRTQSDSALAPAPGSGSQLSKHVNASTSESRAPIEPERKSTAQADEPSSRRPTPAAAARSAAPTRTRSDDALPPAEGVDNRKTTDESGALARRPMLPSTSPSTAPTSLPSSSRPLESSAASGARVVHAVDDGLKKTSVAVHDVDVDDLPDYLSDEEPTASRVPSAPMRHAPPSRAPGSSSSVHPLPPPAPAPATTATTTTTTIFRKPTLPPPRAAASVLSTAPVPSTPAVPVHSSASSSQSQPLFLPDSPSPSPERRESQSQRLMSLPPISFLDEAEVEEIDRAVTEEDELEDELDELESAGGVAVIRKKKRTTVKEVGRETGKTRLDTRPDPVPATDDSAVKKDKTLLNRTPAVSNVSTDRRKEKTPHRLEQEQEEVRSYAQQLVDERLKNVSGAGLTSLLDCTHQNQHAGEGDSSVKVKKKHRDRDRDRDAAVGVVDALEKKTKRAVLGADAGGGEGESSTSSSVKKKKHRDRDRDPDAAQSVVNTLARPSLDLSASLEKMEHADAESSTSGSVKEKEKKKHRERDRNAVDPLARPSLDPSASLEKMNKRKHLDTDVGAGESSTSSSVKVKKKKKKHRDRDRDAAQGVVDPFTVPSLGLSASATLGKKTKHAVLGADADAGESSTSGSAKEKKKKHRDTTQGVVDALARPALGLSVPPEKTKSKHGHLDTDAGGESSTSSSVKKKHRDRDAGVVVAPAKFKEPATPDAQRRVDDLTVSWGRLQQLASFSPSSAKKTTMTTAPVDGDGDSFPSTVREEASSRQLGRKTARPPPLLDDSPSLTLDKSPAVSSTRPPLAAMSAAKQPLPPARFPTADAAAAGSSSTVPASSSSSAARLAASTSRPDAEQQKQKEKQPMQMQRARKTVSRREDRDDAPAQARGPAPSSSASALPERMQAAAPDRADGHDAPAKGKSTLDKYSARAVASSSSSSTVLPPSTSTSTLPPSTSTSTLLPVVASSSSLKPVVPGPSSSRPSAPSTAPSSSRSKHRVADPSLPFEAPVVPRRKAIAGVDYPLPDLPVSPARAQTNKKATARKVPLVSEEEAPMDVDVDVDVRAHTSRKGKEKEHAITVDDDSPPQPKEKARPESRPKPPPIPRLRSASIWSSSTPTPAPYTTSSPSLDAVTAFLKKRRMANPLPSSSTLPSAPTQGQKMAATKRRLERGEHESDLPVPMSVLANAREMQTLRRLVKRSVVVDKPEYRVGEVKSDVVMPFDWATYRTEAERKEKEKYEQGVGDFDTT